MATFNFLLKRFKSLSPLDPERDWLVLVILSVIMLSGIIVWNAWAFDTVVNGGVIGSPASSTPPIFNQSALDAIRTVFDNRATEETKYTSDVYHYIDPSQ